LESQHPIDPTSQRPSPEGAERSVLLALIITNLLPLAGVLFLQWDLLAILLFYWLESLVRGAFAPLRAVLHSGLSAVGSAVLFVLVAIVMGAAHLAVLVVLAEAIGQAGPFAPDLSKVTSAGLVAALGGIYQAALAWILLERPLLLLLALPAEAVWQWIELWRGPRRAADQALGSANAILRHALGGLAGLHLALLLGAAAIAALGLADLLPVLAVLMLFKLVADLRSHRAAARLAAQADRP
jgi:hypothetical protein